MDKLKIITELISGSAKEVKLLPVEEDVLKLISENVQLDAEGLLGTVVLNFGGIVIDNWLRIYGAGKANFYKRNTDFSFNGILVAEDILGGLFAWAENGYIWYFAPDTLEWEDLEIDYSQFINWCLNGDTDAFYSDFRWSTWREDVANLPIEKGMSFYPFLWAKAESMDARSRREISMDEMIRGNVTT